MKAVKRYVEGMKVRDAIGNIGTVIGSSIDDIWIYVQWPNGERSGHCIKYGTPSLFEVEDIK